MKILIIQDHLRSGGAARAAGRWIEPLKRQGWEVRQVAGDEVPDHGHLLTGKPPRGFGRVRELFSDRAQQRAARVKRGLVKILNSEKPDVVWFHNIAGGEKWGWGVEMIQIAREHAPVLWTLHDMWALGGSSKSYWQEGSVVESGKGQGAGGRKAEESKGLGVEESGL